MKKTFSYDSNGEPLPYSEIFDHIEEEWDAQTEKGEAEGEDEE